MSRSLDFTPAQAVSTQSQDQIRSPQVITFQSPTSLLPDNKSKGRRVQWSIPLNVCRC
jgi:hypothetical protein